MLRVILAAFILHATVIYDARAQLRIVPDSRPEMQLSFAPIVKKAAPAVVNIYTKRKEKVRSPLSPLFADPFFEQFFGQRGLGGVPRERVVSSLGSGVIIDARGVVVTSHHVIEGAEDIIAVLADRREFKARLLVADPATDLALLKLEAGGKSPLPKDEALPALSIVDSDRVEVGDLVLAIGNPFGVGQTVTSGIVSALARSATGVTDYDFFIQTDAAINPGNSGGALVNMQGELIGINSAIFSKTGGSLGIGFAVPSNMVLSVLRNTQADGTVMRPWLGATYQDVTPEIAQSLGLSRPQGVLIANVAAGSPAASAGLRVGDVIQQVGGVQVRDVQELKFRIHTAGTGKATQIVVFREGTLLTRAVQLAPPPEEPARDARTLQGSHPLAGVTLVNLSPRLAIELGLDVEAAGVAIYTVGGSQNASRFGLQKGDIIRNINNTAITSTRQLESLMEDRVHGWHIRFERGGQEMGLSVQR